MLCGLDRSAREVRVAALKTDGCLGMALTQSQQHMAARMLWAGEVVVRESERRPRRIADLFSASSSDTRGWQGLVNNGKKTPKATPSAQDTLATCELRS